MREAATRWNALGCNVNGGEMSPMIRLAVEGCLRNRIHSGLCGQAPSDYPDMAEYLVEIGIDSISLNPDTVIKTTQRILELESQVDALQKRLTEVLSELEAMRTEMARRERAVHRSYRRDLVPLEESAVVVWRPRSPLQNENN